MVKPRVTAPINTTNAIKIDCSISDHLLCSGLPEKNNFCARAGGPHTAFYILHSDTDKNKKSGICMPMSYEPGRLKTKTLIVDWYVRKKNKGAWF